MTLKHCSMTAGMLIMAAQSQWLSGPKVVLARLLVMM